MLAGEHAVLHGRPALVCAVDRRLEVRMGLRDDRRVRIRSDLGEAETTLASLALPPEFRFLETVLSRHAHRLPSGVDVDVISNMSATQGLGTSAAVTVAALAAARALAGCVAPPEALIREARAVIGAVQGRGSGADAAAAVLGGLVAYRADPFHAEKLAHVFPVTLVYAGYKTPTAEVIRRVDAARAADPDRFERIFDAIGDAARAAESAARSGEARPLGAALNDGQAAMETLGVVDAALAEIVSLLRARPGILGAKVSGSGLGDCALGLGRTEWRDPRYPEVPVAMSPRGLEVVEE
jgi:mevalonate kinase